MSRTLTLAELRKQPTNTPVYVLNTASASNYTKGAPGEVLLSIAQMHGNGQPTVIRIAPSWLPEELTKHVTREQILQSQTFMKAADKGLISILSETYAEQLNRHPDAAAERERVRQILDNTRHLQTVRSISDSKVQIIGPEDDTEGLESSVVAAVGSQRKNTPKSVAAQTLEGLEADEHGLDPSFTMWANRLISETDDVVASAVRLRKPMKRRELKFLVSILKTHPKSQAHLKDRLAKLSKSGQK